ncbi:MAG: RDD family protein [Paludibacteraceae bacterium]|nr:RDD family protein [Paludibacteraceae bacterium]
MAKKQKVDITTAEYVLLQYEGASTGVRISAAILDWFACWISFAIIVATFDISGADDTSFYLFSTIYLGFFTLAQEYFFSGVTIGKKIMKIRVVNEICAPPSLIECFTRWLIFPLDSFIVGLVLMSKNGRRLGDYASGCFVVSRNVRNEIAPQILRDYKYVEPNYKPKYTREEIARLDEKNGFYLDQMNSGLFNPTFVPSSCAALIRKIIHGHNENDVDFLVNLRNDYYYYKNNKE